MSPLSPRQQQVLEHIATGASNKEVAAALDISDYAVKFHVLDIAQRLGVKTRVQSVVRGLQLGLLKLDTIKVLGATS